MKNKYRVFLIVILLGGISGLISCSKKLDTNLSNPNGVPINDLTPKDLFEQALLSTVTNKLGSNVSTATTNNQYVQEWMGYLARNNGWSASGLGAHIEGYALSFTDADGTWQSLYHNIYDYNYILTDSVPNSILVGAARVMRAMVFQDLVDQFGNIPYSQAVQPVTNRAPAYDSAQTIYKDLIVQIDSAITELNASQSTDDDAVDIMFKGNKASWLAFANTLKLRILLRQVPNVYQPTDGYIKTELSSVAANGGFLGVGQDAEINPGFVDANLQQSPFWADYGLLPGGGQLQQNNSYYGANNVLLERLESLADPRIAAFYVPIKGKYVGNDEGNNANSASTIGPGILQSAAMPALLLSASQSLFMQAEAAQRGMLTGDVDDLYKKAVEESFRYLKVTNAQTAADNYISGANASVNLSKAADPVNTILTQKWIAECMLDPLEAYCDYRRTGFPAIYSSTSLVTPQKRLLYPESEFINNSANVNAQGSGVTDQSWTGKKLFWGL